MVIVDILIDVLLPQRRYPENFVLISQMEVCQEGGSRMMFFYPTKGTLKVLCQYIYYWLRYLLNKELDL